MLETERLSARKKLTQTEKELSQRDDELRNKLDLSGEYQVMEP